MRLRAIVSGIDPLTAQSRLATLLNNTCLYPTGLGPSAIVFIRKLRDPLPGSLRLNQRDLRPPVAWERALASLLDQMVRNAARPALGAVPAKAEAVAFADRSELLACLASDWCDGIAITRWWWQSLFKATEVTHAVLREWLDRPEYIPATLARLAENQKATQFISSLGAAEVRSMLEGITRTFALGELNLALEVVLNHGLQSNRPQGFDEQHSISNETAPWRRWVAESTGAAHIEQACLLAVGLMLARAPAVIRSPGFARAVLEWHQAAINEQAVIAKSESSMNASAAAKMEDGLLATRLRLVTGDSRADSAGETLETLRELPAPTADEKKSPAPLPELEAQPAISNAIDMTEHVAGEPTDHLIAIAEMSSTIARAQEDFRLFEAQIETEHGGVFYLINLGLFLNLYGDFTTPAQPGIALPIWDFIALIGHQLSADTIQSDPVWSLLAQLAGRSEQQEPGDGFQPPDIWSVPADWPVPACESLKDESHRESDLKRWIDWLMPYVRERLNKALGLSEASELRRVLLDHRARIFVTATHLDVLFSLDELPVEVRLSGLDRNPGWVPAAGRFIAFHFD